MSLCIWTKDGFSKAVNPKAISYNITEVIHRIKYSQQRLTRGFSDEDVWNINDFTKNLIKSLLVDTRAWKINREDSFPLYEPTVKKKYEEEIALLDEMIFLFNESDRETCSRKNPYEEAYSKAFGQFTKLYGLMGSGLQTKDEIEEEKRSHLYRMHMMDELPSYQDIHKKYMDTERELDQYCADCRMKAFQLFIDNYESVLLFSNDLVHDRNLFDKPQRNTRFKTRIKYAKDRIQKGYCNRDFRNADSYVLSMLAAMLERLQQTRHGYAILTDDANDYKGNEKVFSDLLDSMIDFFTEANPETCTRQNNFKEVYAADSSRDIHDIWIEEEKKLLVYQEDCRTAGFKLFSKYYDTLWD